MRLSRIVLVLALTGAPAFAQAANPPSATLRVADRYFADSTTIGARLFAKFDRLAALDSVLRLTAPVVTYAGRAWLVRDILVDIDLNANGTVAIWRVAGPRAVVEAHIAGLEALALRRSPVYDHAITRLTVRCACN